MLSSARWHGSGSLKARDVRDLGSCWPSGERRFLLEIAGAPDHAAHRAWRAWQAELGGAEPDLWSVRLLPLLARRLGKLGVAGARARRLQGAYRHTWCNNQLRLRRAAAAADALARAGVDVMALKGLALLPRAYGGDVGLRAMLDVDLLVRRDQIAIAARVLRDRGFQTTRGVDLEQLCDGNLPRDRHSCSLRAGDTEIDLHWHFSYLDRSETLEATVWQRAERVTIGGAPLWVPAPEELLLLVCSHGVCWTEAGSVSWPIDAQRLIAAAPLDWAHTLELASSRLLTLPFYDALRFARDVLAAGVPESIMNALGGTDVSAIEQSEYRAVTTPRYSASFGDRVAGRELIRLRQELDGAVRQRVLEPRSAGIEAWS